MGFSPLPLRTVGATSSTEEKDHAESKATRLHGRETVMSRGCWLDRMALDALLREVQQPASSGRHGLSTPYCAVEELLSFRHKMRDTTGPKRTSKFFNSSIERLCTNFCAHLNLDLRIAKLY